MSDRNFEIGKDQAGFDSQVNNEGVVDSTCLGLRKSLRKLASSFDLFNQEEDSVLGIPVGQIIVREDEVNWGVIGVLEEVHPGFADRFQAAWEERVNGTQHFSRKTQIAQEKAVRAPGSVCEHKPRIVKRGPTRYSED